MTRPGIEPRSPRPLTHTQIIRLMEFVLIISKYQEISTVGKLRFFLI